MRQRKYYFGFLPAEVSNKECADTAMAMTLICLLAAMYLRSLALLPLAVGLLLLGMVWARAYKPLAMLWLGLSLALGAVMSRLILCLIFFIVVTPLALVMRLFGHDPMRRGAWKKDRQSTFVTRDHQFTAEDLENPF